MDFICDQGSICFVCMVCVRSYLLEDKGDMI